MLIHFYEERDKYSNFYSDKRLASLTYENADKNKEMIVEYMKNCPMLIASPGMLIDRVNDTGKYILLGSYFFTDGIWMWSNELIYYIEKYNIELPSEFILHIKSNNSKPIVLSEEERLKLTNEFLKNGITKKQ